MKLRDLNWTIALWVLAFAQLVGCEYLDKKAAEINAQEAAATQPDAEPDFTQPSTDANGAILEAGETMPRLTPVPSATPKPKATPAPLEKDSQTSVGQRGGAGYTNMVTNVYGGTSKQRARLLKIAKNVETIINSGAFEKRLLGNKYKGKTGFYGTTAKPDYVLKELRESDEFNKGKRDHIWQYELYIQKLPAGVLGRMYWPKVPIYFNSSYLDNRADSGLAGTYCHEKSHQLGFTHSQFKTSERIYSVPYTLGTICAELYKALKL